MMRMYFRNMRLLIHACLKNTWHLGPVTRGLLPFVTAQLLVPCQSPQPRPSGRNDERPHAAKPSVPHGIQKRGVAASSAVIRAITTQTGHRKRPIERVAESGTYVRGPKAWSARQARPLASQNSYHRNRGPESNPAIRSQLIISMATMYFI